MKEIWMPIREWEGFYEVSNFGRIRSIKRKRGKRVDGGKFMKPRITQYGYLYIGLSRNGAKKYFFVHRLVAIAFIPNPKQKPYVDHRDNNRLNARIDNLQWVTESENNQYSFDRGRPPVKSWLGKSGKNHNKSKKVICVTSGQSFGSVMKQRGNSECGRQIYLPFVEEKKIIQEDFILNTHK